MTCNAVPAGKLEDPIGSSGAEMTSQRFQNWVKDVEYQEPCLDKYSVLG